MAVEKAGVILVAEGYDDYMNKLRQVNAQQQATFSGGGSALAGVQKQTQATTSAMGGLAGALGTVKGAMGAVTAVFAAFMAIDIVRGLKQFMDTSLQVAMRNETLGVSLQVVGKQAGYSAEQIAYVEAQVKKQGITTQAARQSLIRLAQANIEFADAAKLARIAQDAAVIGNINSSEAFERMIYGIQSGQTEVLKTIGINVQFEASYRKLAQQLGKGRLELTEAEKAQARSNAVMEAGTRIAGTYEAAMNTAGKQQQSMARYVEETQNNLGKLMLPFEELKIRTETDFWKGVGQVAIGLQAWEPIIRQSIKAMEGASSIIGDILGKMAGFQEGETFWDRLAEGAYNFGHFFVLQLEAVQAIVAALTEKLTALIMGPVAALQKLSTGDVAGAMQAMAKAQEIASKPLGTTVMDYFNQGVKEWIDEYPEFAMTYKEYQKSLEGVETGLTRQKSATDIAIEGLDKQRTSLEGVLNAMKQVEKVQRQYDKGVSKAGSQRDKALAEAAAQVLKDRQKAAEEFAQAMAKLDQDYARQLADLQAKQNIDLTRAQAELYRSLKRMEEAYQLQKTQSTRRFQLSERRALADGDILALMQLREDHELEVQEAKENYEKQRGDAKEDGEEKLKQQREDMQRQIDELGVSIQERRAQLAQTYQEELDQITASNTERNAQIQASYVEQLEDLRASRDEQLSLLGESLRDEGTVTQEGMDRLQAILNSLFGESGAGDALIKGFKDRSEAAIVLWVDALSAELARLEAQMDRLRTGAGVPDLVPVRPPLPPGTPQHAGMRTGGIGVVTGPKIFEVEPGRKEFFMFAPMRGGRQAQTINAIVSGGIDIRGAEGASQSVVNAAVTTTMGELREAIKRMSTS